jgi:hypothetical protein
MSDRDSAGSAAPDADGIDPGRSAKPGTRFRHCRLIPVSAAL